MWNLPLLSKRNIDISSRNVEPKLSHKVINWACHLPCYHKIFLWNPMFWKEISLWIAAFKRMKKQNTGGEGQRITLLDPLSKPSYYPDLAHSQAQFKSPNTCCTSTFLHHSNPLKKSPKHWKRQSLPPSPTHSHNPSPYPIEPRDRSLIEYVDKEMPHHLNYRPTSGLAGGLWFCCIISSVFDPNSHSRPHPPSDWKAA